MRTGECPSCAKGALCEDTCVARRAGVAGGRHADPKTTMVYVDDSPSDRERLMLLASDEPTALDIDRAA